MTNKNEKKQTAHARDKSKQRRTAARNGRFTVVRSSSDRVKGARESSKELVPPAAAPTPSAYRPSQNHLGRNFRSGTTASKHRKKKKEKCGRKMTEKTEAS